MTWVSRLTRIASVLGVAVGYGLIVYMGSTEEKRRELKIDQPATAEDSVILNVTVTSIDTKSSLATERIRLIPTGKYAIDKSTPSKDLKLLINSISGQQTITFPKGSRIAPISATTILTGNPNRYPFDGYSTDIDFLVTTPAPKPIPPVGIDDTLVSATPPEPYKTGSLVIGTSDLKHSDTIPISQNIAASLPQFKLKGSVDAIHEDNLARTHIVARRANYVVAVSIVTMTIMMLLAISIMAMVLRVTDSPGEINLLPLSLCITLIFGLPALRNVQPDVPGIGVLGDYLSFFWAQFIVTTSAVALAWTWIVRTQEQDRKIRLAQEAAQNAQS